MDAYGLGTATPISGLLPTSPLPFCSLVDIPITSRLVAVAFSYLSGTYE